MPSLSESRLSPRWCLVLTWLTVTGVLLAPWWRNRDYLRDFFDYGLMMVGAGRILRGEMPYVDFVSPLQSAGFWLNAGAERFLGGNYLALTWGNALFIVAALGLLASLLGDKHSRFVALLVAASVVAGTACQHTIIWYNAIGVVTLAGVAWSMAMNPVISRRHYGKALIVIGLLVVSGMNKLNYHALTLATACAWTLRAGLMRKSPWPNIAGSLAIWLFAGLVLPLMLELQLTGASFAQWKAQVIDMPFSARGGNLTEVISVEFLLRPMHDYYGPVLKPVGLIILLWLGLTVVLAWPRRSWIDRLMLVGASIIALGGAGGLMATNHEIIYLTMAAGIVMIVALWLGYDLWKRPRLRNTLLVGPIALLGLVMLHSAWLGQRSQFGHEQTPRSDYRTFTAADSSFDYLADLHLTPQWHESLLQLRGAMPPPDANGTHPVFYTSGAEFLDRIWRQPHPPVFPLLIADLNFGPAQNAAISEILEHPFQYSHIVGLESWNNSWPDSMHFLAAANTRGWEEGLFSVHQLIGEGLRDGLRPRNDSITVLNLYRGNTDPDLITIDQPLWPYKIPEQPQIMLGTNVDTGAFTLHQSAFRLQGHVVLLRPHSTDPSLPLTATFQVNDALMEPDVPGAVIWRKTFTLPPGVHYQEHEYKVDSRGHPSQFAVQVAPNSAEKIKAGFLLPRINHSDATPSPPPTLRKPSPADIPLASLAKLNLLPSDWRTDTEIVLRGGEVNDQGQVFLTGGGELWLKPSRPISGLNGRLTIPADAPRPVVRIIWSRGGRVEIYHQTGINAPDGVFHFNAWPAEGDGWYGILIDPGHTPQPVRVEIDHISPQ